MDIQVTETIRVTDFRRSDAAALVRWLDEPEIYARTLRIPSPYMPADAEKWLNLLESAEDSESRLERTVKKTCHVWIGASANTVRPAIASRLKTRLLRRPDQ